MIYFLLILSVVTASGKALFGKAIGNHSTTFKQTLLLNFQSFSVSLVCAILFTVHKIGSIFTVSPYTIILALIFSVSVTATQITQSKAMSMGASSSVSLIYSFGFTVPIIYGLFVWKETVSVFQYVGLALLIVALVLIVYKREKSEKKGLSWFVLALLAMLGSGINGIIQKTHQLSSFSGEIDLFLLYTMLFSTVLTGIATLIVKDKTRTTEQNPVPLWQRIVLPIGMGVCVCALNFINLYLSGKLPSVVFFPIYNIGNLLLTTVVSAIIFKDKTTVIQNIGLGVGIAAILIIGLL